MSVVTKSVRFPTLKKLVPYPKRILWIKSRHFSPAIFGFSSSFRVYSFVVSKKKRRWKKHKKKNPRLRIGIIYKRDVKLHRFNQFLKVFWYHQIVNKFLYLTNWKSFNEGKLKFVKKKRLKIIFCEEKNNNLKEKDNF